MLEYSIPAAVVCCASTGHIVVDNIIVSVVTEPRTAGQFVTVGAHEVMV